MRSLIGKSAGLSCGRVAPRMIARWVEKPSSIACHHLLFTSPIVVALRSKAALLQNVEENSIEVFSVVQGEVAFRVPLSLPRQAIKGVMGYPFSQQKCLPPLVVRESNDCQWATGKPLGWRGNR